MARSTRLILALVLVCSAAGPLGAQSVSFTRSNSGLVDNFVTVLLEFNGLPMAGTHHGVSFIHPDRFENDARGQGGFPDAPVSAAAVFGGRLWVGTLGKGLARREGGTWKPFSTTNSGLPDDFVSALAVMNNRLYVGTRAGLCSFDGMLWELISLGSRPAPPITALAADGATLLVGTNAGLFRWAPGQGAQPLPLGNSNDSWIDAVAVTLGGTVFAANEEGVNALLPDGRRMQWSRDRLPSTRIFGLTPLDNGALAGTAKGLVSLAIDGQVSLVDAGFGDPRTPVTAMHRAGGFWWIGTAGSGLRRLPGNALDGAPGTGLSQAPAVSPTTPVVPVAPVAPVSSPGETAGSPTGGQPIISEVRAFPLPPETRGDVTQAPSAPPVPAGPLPPTSLALPAVGAGAAPAIVEQASPGRVPPPWTIRKKPVKPKNLTYFKDILPVMGKECISCHTTGTGKSFPLHDPQMLIPYFKKAGVDRMAGAMTLGGGMEDKVDPKTFELIQIWVKEGCRE